MRAAAEEGVSELLSGADGRGWVGSERSSGGEGAGAAGAAGNDLQNATAAAAPSGLRRE